MGPPLNNDLHTVSCKTSIKLKRGCVCVCVCVGLEETVTNGVTFIALS